MIKSMTAYSNAEENRKGMTISAEMRSVNNRYLDLVIRTPQAYGYLEDKIRRLVSGKISRGRIEIRIQIAGDSDDSTIFEIDTEKADAYYQAISELKAKFGLNTEISLDHMMAANNIIRPVERETDMEAVWPAVQECLEKAVEALDVMKITEGAFIESDLSDRIDFIDACVDQIRGESENLLPAYIERLKERIHKLTDGVADIDPDRISQEAAFLADKSDITEEIVRAKSHVEHFKELMASNETTGRSLNFLLQEMHREFNTMGAKVGNASVSHVIVDAKSEIEKIREQVQNIE